MAADPGHCARHCQGLRWSSVPTRALGGVWESCAGVLGVITARDDIIGTQNREAIPHRTPATDAVRLVLGAALSIARAVIRGQRLAARG